MNWSLLGRALLLVSGTLHLANAAVIIDVVESGADVVATVSGTINMSGLSLVLASSVVGMIYGDYSDGTIFAVGATSPTGGSLYAVNSATPFVSSHSGIAYASSGSGMVFGVVGASQLFVASSYTSGEPISSTSTWHNMTFADLGLTAGSYVYTWGLGPSADSLTINVLSGSPVPEPGTTALFGVGGLGLFLVRRLRRA